MANRILYLRSSDGDVGVGPKPDIEDYETDEERVKWAVAKELNNHIESSGICVERNDEYCGLNCRIDVVVHTESIAIECKAAGKCQHKVAIGQLVRYSLNWDNIALAVPKSEVCEGTKAMCNKIGAALLSVDFNDGYDVKTETSVELTN